MFPCPKQLFFFSSFLPPCRITGFHDQWPKLEKWFVKFGTLKTVDASLEKDSVFLETEKILEDTLARVIKVNCRTENKSL